MFLLRTKNEAAIEIINHARRMEVIKDTKVKDLRSDNGTEFKNSTMMEFCNEKSISQKISAPRTPQRNGLVERRNITLIETARTILVSSGLKPLIIG